MSDASANDAPRTDEEFLQIAIEQARVGRSEGGIPIGNPLNKVLFAAKYQDTNILLSDLVNEESKILEVRDPRDRVEKVAPWLTVDGDPYPVVADGRVLYAQKEIKVTLGGCGG